MNAKSRGGSGGVVLMASTAKTGEAGNARNSKDPSSKAVLCRVTRGASKQRHV